jgi:hypothetical protein
LRIEDGMESGDHFANLERSEGLYRWDQLSTNSRTKLPREQFLCEFWKLTDVPKCLSDAGFPSLALGTRLRVSSLVYPSRKESL